MLLWAEVVEAEVVVHSVEAEAAAVRSAETEEVPVAAAAAVGAVAHLAAVHLAADLMVATAGQADRFSGQDPSLYQADQDVVTEEDQVIMVAEEETPDADVEQS